MRYTVYEVTFVSGTSTNGPNACMTIKTRDKEDIQSIVDMYNMPGSYKLFSIVKMENITSQYE